MIRNFHFTMFVLRFLALATAILLLAETERTKPNPKKALLGFAFTALFVATFSFERRSRP